MKIIKDLKFLIHGKNEDGVLLMIPVYNPVVGEHYAQKFIEDTSWTKLIIETPTHDVIYQR